MWNINFTFGKGRKFIYVKLIEVVKEWLRKFVRLRDETLRIFRLREYDSVIEIESLSNLSNLCSKINKGSFFLMVKHILLR